MAAGDATRPGAEPGRAGCADGQKRELGLAAPGPGERASHTGPGSGAQRCHPGPCGDAPPGADGPSPSRGLPASGHCDRQGWTEQPRGGRGVLGLWAKLGESAPASARRPAAVSTRPCREAETLAPARSVRDAARSRQDDDHRPSALRASVQRRGEPDTARRAAPGLGRGALAARRIRRGDPTCWSRRPVPRF